MLYFLETSCVFLLPRIASCVWYTVLPYHCIMY